MSEPTVKEMLRSLDGKVDHMIGKQDKMKTKQDKMETVQNNILIELSGTTMEPERGMVYRLRQAEECLARIKKKQYKINMVGVIAIAAANLLFLAIKSFVILIKG